MDHKYVIVYRCAFEATDDKAAADPKPADPKPATEMFSQEDVNRMLAADRRKHQIKLDEQNALLTESMKQKDMSNEELTDLQTRFETLRQSNLTEEQKLKEAFESKTKETNENIKRLEADVETWKQLHTDATLDRSLIDACTGEVKGITAVNPAQVLAILKPNTQLVEALDDDGKPSGKLVPKVTFKDIDKDGKPVTLTLAPAEAVQRLAAKDNFQNLFVGDGVSGLNGNNRGNASDLTQAEAAKLPAPEYRKWKEKHPGAIA